MDTMTQDAPKADVGLTVVQLADDAIERLKQLQTEGHSGNRELALAITNFEQAQMWATRGLAIRQGKFAPADLER